jgi:hypothetical protein
MAAHHKRSLEVIMDTRRTDDDEADSPLIDPAHGANTRRSDRPEFDGSEEVERLGMSSEGIGSDDAETMASTGNAGGSFVEIAAGTATGLGIDRAAATGTGGLASGEDLDPVAEGDYWRENFRFRPYFASEKPYEHFEPGFKLGWEAAIDRLYEGLSFEEIESELRETWELRTGESSPSWEEVREAARDAFERARVRDG